MNVSFNRDHLTFKLSVDKDHYEEDLLMGMRLERMMETDDFKVLLGEWIKADELYRNAIMKVGMTDETDKKTGKKAAAYNGFNEATTFCKKFVDACNVYRKSEIKRIDEELKIKSTEDLDVPTYD